MALSLGSVLILTLITSVIMASVNAEGQYVQYDYIENSNEADYKLEEIPVDEIGDVEEILISEYPKENTVLREQSIERVNRIRRPRNWPEYLQDYIPGSVRLFENSQDVFVLNDGTLPKRRAVFYQIDGFIINLVPHEEWVLFRDSMLVGLGEEPETMPLLLFIQHFNISRDMLESALMQMHEASVEISNYLTQTMLEIKAEERLVVTENTSMYPSLQEHGIMDIDRNDPFTDLLHEVHELPNLDIIFTFDNDIINWYFRRE